MDLGNSRNTNDVIKRENNEYRDSVEPKNFNLSMGLPKYEYGSEVSEGGDDRDLHMDVDDDEDKMTVGSSSVGGGDTSVESDHYNMQLLADMSQRRTRQALNQEEFYTHQHMQQHLGERSGDDKQKQQQQQQQETNNYNSSTNELTVNNTFSWTGGVGTGATSSVGEPLFLTSTSGALFHHSHPNSFLPSASSPSSSSSVKHHHHNNHNRPQDINIKQADSGKFTPELKSPLDQVVSGSGGSDASTNRGGDNDKQNQRFHFSNSVVVGHNNHQQEMDDPPLNDRDKEAINELGALLDEKSSNKDKQQQQQQQVADNLPDYNHATQHQQQVYARPMSLPISNDTSVHVQQQQQFLSRKRSNDNLYVKIETAAPTGDVATNNDVIVVNTFSSVTSAAPHQLTSYSTNSMVSFDHDANYMNFHSSNQQQQHHQQQINFEQTNLHNIANNQQQQQQGKQQQETNGSNCDVRRNRRNSAVSLPSPKQQQRTNNKQYQQQIMDDYQQQQQQQQQYQPVTTTTLIQYTGGNHVNAADANVNPLLAIAAAEKEKLLAEEGCGTSEQQQQLYQQQSATTFTIPSQLIQQQQQFGQQQPVYIQNFGQQQNVEQDASNAATSDTSTASRLFLVSDAGMYANNNSSSSSSSIPHNSLSLLAVAAANQDQLATTNQQQAANEAEQLMSVSLGVDELNSAASVDYPVQPADLSTNSQHHGGDVTGWMTSQQQQAGGGTAGGTGGGAGGGFSQDNETSPIRTNHDPFISPANMTSSGGGASSSAQAPSSGDGGGGDGSYGGYGTRDGGNPVVNNIALNAVVGEEGKVGGGHPGSGSVNTVTFGNSFGPGYVDVDPLMAEAFDVADPSNILPHSMMGGTPSGGAFFQGSSSSRPLRQRHHSEGAHLIRSHANQTMQTLKYSPPLPPPHQQPAMTSQQQQRHHHQQHYQQQQQCNNNNVINKQHPHQMTSPTAQRSFIASSGFHGNNSAGGGGSSTPAGGGTPKQQQCIDNYDVTSAASAGDFPSTDQHQQQLLNNTQQQAPSGGQQQQQQQRSVQMLNMAPQQQQQQQVVTSQAVTSSAAAVASQPVEKWVMPGPRPIIDASRQRRRRRHSADCSRLNARQHNSVYYHPSGLMGGGSRNFKKLALGRENRVKTIPPPLHIPQSVNTLTPGGGSSSNLYQSNLHQRPSRRPSGESNASLNGSTLEKFPPYTPPPMLSPMRHGSGLYCKTPGTPSAKFMRQVSGSESLASSIPPILEVDENQHDNNSTNSVGGRSRHSSIHALDYDVTGNTIDFDSEGEEISIRSSEPKINLGPRFQATIPSRIGRPGGHVVSPRDVEGCELMWKTDVTSSDEKFREVESYLDLSCSAVMPYGGPNKELALHVLYRHGGNVEEATKTLILNATSAAGGSTSSYHYTGSGRLWTDDEVKIYNENLEDKTNKDFFLLSKKIVTRTTAECVERYYHVYKRKHQKEKNERKVRMKRTRIGMDGGDMIQQSYEIQQHRPLHIATNDVTDMSMVAYDHHQDFSNLQLHQQTPSHYNPPSYATGNVTSQSNKQQQQQQQPYHHQIVTNVQMARIARMSSPSASPGGSPGSVASQPDEFQCPVCTKSFAKVKSRNAHMKTHGKQAQEKRRQRQEEAKRQEAMRRPQPPQPLYVTSQYNPPTIQPYSSTQLREENNRQSQLPTVQDVLSHYVNENPS